MRQHFYVNICFYAKIFLALRVKFLSAQPTFILNFYPGADREYTYVE